MKVSEEVNKQLSIWIRHLSTEFIKQTQNTEMAVKVFYTYIKKNKNEEVKV